jgi:ParB family chromosome partitioning protein
MKKDLKKMLEEKLQQNNQRHTLASQSVEFSEGREYDLIPTDKIYPNPYQPRRSFPQEDIDKLANSISEIGLLEPILIRKNEEGGYQIAAGERRWRAHKQLNKLTIEAIVTNISDSDMAIFALAENVNREDLSDYEIGLSLRQIENAFPSKKKLAESLGLNREDMYKYFAYYDLPEFILTDLNTNPRLLSRSAASDIKRLLNQHKDSKFINTCLLEAWSLLLAEELEQTKIAGYITRRLKGLHENQPNCHIQNSHNLIKDGKKVGSLSWTGKHLTVRLNTDVINVEKEEKLREFIKELIDVELAEM